MSRYAVYVLAVASMLATIVAMDQHRRLNETKLQLLIWQTSYGAFKDAVIGEALKSVPVVP